MERESTDMAAKGESGFPSLRSIVVFVVVVDAIAVTVRFGIWANLVETGLYVMLLAAVVCAPGVRAVLGRAPRWQVMALAALVGAVLAGQLTLRHTLFPFDRWAMYREAEAPEKVRYYEFLLTLDDGEVMEFNPGRTVRAGHSRLMTLMSRLGDGTPKLGAEMDEVLRGIMALYNRRNPDRPAVRITALRCEFPLERYDGGRAVERRVVCDVDI